MRLARGHGLDREDREEQTKQEGREETGGRFKFHIERRLSVGVEACTNPASGEGGFNTV